MFLKNTDTLNYLLTKSYLTPMLYFSNVIYNFDHVFPKVSLKKLSSAGLQKTHISWDQMKFYLMKLIKYWLSFVC